MALVKWIVGGGLARNKTWAAGGLEATPHLGDVSSPRVKTEMTEMKSGKEMFGLCWDGVFSLNLQCSWA